MVCLRADVRDAQKHILGQLAFESQIVLLRILSFQMRRKFAE